MHAQEGGQLPIAQQLMVTSQAMQMAGMPQAMPSDMGQMLPSGPTPPPLDPQMDRPMGKPRLKRRTIADMCLEGQQVILHSCCWALTRLQRLCRMLPSLHMPVFYEVSCSFSFGSTAAIWGLEPDWRAAHAATLIVYCSLLFFSS